MNHLLEVQRSQYEDDKNSMIREESNFFTEVMKGILNFVHGVIRPMIRPFMMSSILFGIMLSVGCFIFGTELLLAQDKSQRVVCEKPYQIKIRERASANSFKKLFKPVSEYRDVYSLITKARKKNYQDALLVKAFQEISKKHQIDGHVKNLSIEEFAAQLVQMDHSMVLCEPTVVKYSELVKSFPYYIYVAHNPGKGVGTVPRERLLRERLAVLDQIVRVEKGLQRSKICSKTSVDVNAPTLRKQILLDSKRDTAEPELAPPHLNEEDNDKVDTQGKSGKQVEKECQICFTSFSSEELFASSGCDCALCLGCMGHYAKEKRTLGETLTDCPVCHVGYKAQDLLRAGFSDIDDILDGRLRTLSQLGAVKCELFKKCKGSRCPNGFFTTDNIKNCPICGEDVSLCSLCGRDSHPDKSCDQVWTDHVESCAAIGASSCPNCWTPIQHGGACMHMTCPQCKTEYSEITKLPMKKNGHALGVEYDEGGWPVAYFYPGGRRVANKRQDQSGRRIDIYGNLLTEVMVKVNIDGQQVDVPREVIVSRDGTRYYEYDPAKYEAYEIDVRKGFRRIKKIPYEEHFQFKGEWDQIVARIRKDMRAKAKDVVEKNF
jgi:hypothetical protein